MENIFQTFLDGAFDAELSTKFLQMLIVFFAILFVALAQIFYLVCVKRRADRQTFTVSRDGLNEQSGKIKAIFAKMRMSEKETNSSLILLEEIVMRMHEHTEQVITARVHHFYGRISLILTSYGEKYNPFEAVGDENSESEDHFRDMIFKANQMRLSYFRKGERNIVVIKAVKKRRK